MSKLLAEKLCYAYEEKTVLDNVGIRVEQGEFIGILGRNGSGKSTLIKNLCGILKPKSGRVLLDGRDIAELSRCQLAASIAVLAQEEPPAFSFSVWEMAAMGRGPHKKLFEADNAEDRRIVEQALLAAGVSQLAQRDFAALSGGERQRVLIARALAQQAEILLLDEPTNHLDICFRLQLMELLKDLGLTVAAAVHDLELAAVYCSRVYVMEQGRVVCQGAPAQVITSQLLADVFGVDARVYYEDDGGIRIKYLSAKGVS